MEKLEVRVNGEVALEKELKYVKGSEVVETIKMLVEYGELHRGKKISMLKGLQKLR